MMATNAVPVIGESRPKLAADVLWLGFTAFVFAVILVIVCWPLSAALSVHNPPDAAANQPAANLTPGTSAGSATAAPLPALAGGDRITRLGAFLRRRTWSARDRAMSRRPPRSLHRASWLEPV